MPAPGEPAGFNLVAPYQPMGDQPQAIEGLEAALRGNAKWATLLGVTGSGKTFTAANVIQRLQRPTLVISHNKTLAAQLYAEFKGFFPDNAVEYFVSYYDYYQPEAYVASRDLYIEKESSINEEIEKLRLSATRSLLSRRDVIIVASVSAIYGLGSPASYADLTLELHAGQQIERDDMLRQLVAIQYNRGDMNFQRGKFRVRGDVVEMWPAYEDTVVRIEFFGDEIDRITTVHALTGEILGTHERMNLYPAKHFVVDEPTIERALSTIETELNERHAELMRKGALVEAQRLLSRTKYDLEMLAETGTCPGIENYSRHLTGRAAGERPYCLYDFLPSDYLMIIDESHVTIPQIRGMYAGDRSRKESLVEHGFRLPSAMDNRPLRFEEWETLINQGLFVSATPSEYEAKNQQGKVEQLVRPTGLVDPAISVRPTSGQIDDVIAEVKARCERDERTLITTITKRLAEDVAEFLNEAGIRTTYLHSDIDAIERIEIIEGLRAGENQCLVGVNLLREGLDLPEVSLVVIFDADKQGFLRSEGALIQTMGRAARHLSGQVILYADEESPAMKAAMSETMRRRTYQLEYNEAHGITPRTAIKQGTQSGAFAAQLGSRRAASASAAYSADTPDTMDVATLTTQMIRAAEELRFEEAARLRDVIKAIESGGAAPTPRPRRKRAGVRRQRL